MSSRRNYLKFTFFKVEPGWKRLDEEVRASHKLEFAAACEEFGGGGAQRAICDRGAG